MSLSTALLIAAVTSAVVPAATIRFRPPQSWGDLEKVLVSGAIVVVLFSVAVQLRFDLGVFGIIHLFYLFAVVTVPLLLGIWSAYGFVRRQPTPLSGLYGMVATTIALCGVWATHIEPNWLAVDKVEVAVDIDGPVRIGVLADMQTPNVGDHEYAAVNSILAESPDIVVVPGDLFQGDRGTIQANYGDFVAILRALGDEVEHVAVVSGDSDNAGLLVAMAEAADVLFIDNTIREILVRGQPVRLAGVQVAATAAQINTLADLQTPSEPFTLLVAHRPDVALALPPGSDVDLIVAGHTHGGQVALPFFGPPVTFSNVPRDVAAGGLGVVEGYPIYVSTGVGLERLNAPQVRFGVRPSVGIIDVRPQ